MAMCFEDACPAEDVIAAENNAIATLDALNEALDMGDVILFVCLKLEKAVIAALML